MSSMANNRIVYGKHDIFIMFNDLSQGPIPSEVVLYADVTTKYCIVYPLAVAAYKPTLFLNETVKE